MRTDPSSPMDIMHARQAKPLCETRLMSYKCRKEVSSLIPWALSLFLASGGVTWRKKLLLVPSVVDNFHSVTLREQTARIVFYMERDDL